MQATPVSHNIKKVCVIGPECTGKTDLSGFLAKHYQTSWVEEYARAYLNKLGRPYQQHDLTKIAHGQLRMEDEWVQDANQLLICDTNLLVIKIWSEVKYGEVAPEIMTLIGKRHYDLYLLTYIDIPWEDDPQREHPDRRQELYDRYVKELQAQTSPIVEIKGSRDERRKQAIQAIQQHILK